MADQAKDVFIFRKVRLTVSGSGGGSVDLPISSITISLAESKLPEISLLVDPAHRAAPDGTTDVALPIAPSLVDLAFWNTRLQQLCVDNDAKASLDLEMVIREDGEYVAQELHLKDWIITGAGIVGVQGGGGFTCEIQIQHPAGKIDRAGATVGNVVASPKLNFAAVKNVIQGLTDLMTEHQKFVEAERIKPDSLDGENSCAEEGESIGEAQEAAIRALDKALKNLNKHIEWKKDAVDADGAGYSDLPMENNCLADFQDALKQSLIAYMHGFEDTNLWELLVQVILPEWQLTMIPTYWQETLKVYPYTPWGNPMIEIFDDEISDMNFPGVDPALICGCRVSYETAGPSADFTALGGSGATQESLTGEIFYLPKKALDGKVAGRIDLVTLPTWLSYLGNFDAAAHAAESSPASADSGFTTNESTTGEEPAVEEDTNYLERARPIYAGAAQRFAKAVWLARFRGEVECNFGCCLLLQSDGSNWDEGYVIPGCVARIRSRTGGAVLLDVYLTKVVHIISVANSNVRTECYGAYPRPEGEYKDMAVSGTFNPLYTPDGGSGGGAGGEGPGGGAGGEGSGGGAGGEGSGGGAGGEGSGGGGSGGGGS